MKYLFILAALAFVSCEKHEVSAPYKPLDSYDLLAHIAEGDNINSDSVSALSFTFYAPLKEKPVNSGFDTYYLAFIDTFIINVDIKSSDRRVVFKVPISRKDTGEHDWKITCPDRNLTTPLHKISIY